MEALLFIFDSLVMVLMVIMGLRDDRRAPGEPHTSLFRMRDKIIAPSEAARPAEPERPGWAEWDRADDAPR